MPSVSHFDTTRSDQPPADGVTSEAYLGRCVQRGRDRMLFEKCLVDVAGERKEARRTVLRPHGERVSIVQTEIAVHADGTQRATSLPTVLRRVDSFEDVIRDSMHKFWERSVSADAAPRPSPLAADMSFFPLEVSQSGRAGRPLSFSIAERAAKERAISQSRNDDDGRVGRSMRRNADRSGAPAMPDMQNPSQRGPSVLGLDYMIAGAQERDRQRKLR